MATAKENAELAKKAQAESQKISKEAGASEIASMLGKTKVITINKGEKDEYKLKLQFPGVARASAMRDDCRDPFGNPRRTDFMEEAIKYIIVQPKITSLNWWNSHRGYDEATDEIMQFFTDCLNGDLKR